MPDKTKLTIKETAAAADGVMVMPLSFTSISQAQVWTGFTWMVEDEDKLAELIARVALGQTEIVQSILCKLGKTPLPPKAGFKGAKDMLSAHTEEEVYHRDGWVFQIIAWIGAHHQDQRDDNTLIRPPHIRRADKGTDGLIIEFTNGSVARVVICEEKVTKNPRKTVHEKVWPEFKDFESGRRDNELIASTSDMLAKGKDENRDATVASIFWQKQRAYRVSITVGETNATDEGRKRLFKDYENIVSGDVSRRRAETLYLNDIRPWFSNLSNKALAWIKRAEEMQNAEADNV